MRSLVVISFLGDNGARQPRGRRRHSSPAGHVAGKRESGPTMSFIVLKKKRYKFQVDLCLEELSEVSYSRGIMFAKVRQLDGGSFADVSKR